MSQDWYLIIDDEYLTIRKDSYNGPLYQPLDKRTSYWITLNTDNTLSFTPYQEVLAPATSRIRLNNPNRLWYTLDISDIDGVKEVYGDYCTTHEEAVPWDDKDYKYMILNVQWLSPPDWKILGQGIIWYFTQNGSTVTYGPNGNDFILTTNSLDITLQPTGYIPVVKEGTQPVAPYDKGETKLTLTNNGTRYNLYFRHVQSDPAVCLQGSSLYPGTPTANVHFWANMVLEFFPEECKECGGSCNKPTCGLNKKCALVGSFYQCVDDCQTCAGNCDVDDCPDGYHCGETVDGFECIPDGECETCGACFREDCPDGYHCGVNTSSSMFNANALNLGTVNNTKYLCIADNQDECLTCGGTCNVQSCTGVGEQCIKQTNGEYACQVYTDPPGCTTCGGQCSVDDCPTGTSCRQNVNGDFQCVPTCTGECKGQCKGNCPVGQSCSYVSGQYKCVSPGNECGLCPEGQTCTLFNDVWVCKAHGTPWYRTWWFITILVIIGILIVVGIVVALTRKPKSKQIDVVVKSTQSIEK